MRVWVTLLLLFLGACAAPPPPAPVVMPMPPPPPPAPPAVPTELVVLLPHPDGTVGAITATTGGVDHLLNTPYAALSQMADGTVARGVRSSAEVQAIFGPALQARPLPPVTYALYFMFGTDTLTPESTKMVRGILDEIQRYPAPEIVLIGHTDQVGTEAQNDILSVQRAGRVREGLIRQGLAPDMITVVGRGKREATGVAAKDRRVDLVLR